MTCETLVAYLHKAIDNNQRPHISINNYTPDAVHFVEKLLGVKRLWKNYYKKKSTTANQLQD